MFIRYFLILSVITLYCAFVFNGVAAEENDEVEDRANPAAKAVAKIIGKLFAGAAAGCLAEAANNCKQHWKHPNRAIDCGKEFLRQNKGRCAVGK